MPRFECATGRDAGAAGAVSVEENDSFDMEEGRAVAAHELSARKPSSQTTRIERTLRLSLVEA
jgi:hypothetical protein